MFPFREPRICVLSNPKLCLTFSLFDTVVNLTLTFQATSFDPVWLMAISLPLQEIQYCVGEPVQPIYPHFPGPQPELENLVYGRY